MIWPDYNGVEYLIDGTKHYTFNGVLHRLNGPAIERINGHYTWFFRGKMHRVGAPADEGPLSDIWCIHGKKHRIDGPAVISYFNDHRPSACSWWLNGTKLNWDRAIKNKFFQDKYPELVASILIHLVHQS